jgi:hypothetical protein
MERKKLDQRRVKLWILLLVVMATSIAFTGCLWRIQPQLDQVVNHYDSTIYDSEKKLLLLNIVRMHYDQSPHFTVASNINAAFNLSQTGGFTPTWAESSSNTYALSYSATLGTNPTITIAPMQGKEFAQRLLKPIDPEVVNMLLQQGADKIDMWLRLLGKNFTMEHA